MSVKSRILKIVSQALSEDFDKAPSFMSMFGNKKATGEIGWEEYSKQRQQYKGTTYACIRKIAPAVAAAGLHLFIPEGNGDINESKKIPVAGEMKDFLLTRAHCKAIMTVNEEVEEITQHAALDVFKRANGSMTRSQLFDKTMILMELQGNSYWKPVMNQTGAFPVRINMIPTEIIKPIEKDGEVTGYAMRRKRPLNPKKFKLEEIVHFFYPNPHSLSQGYSPVAAASQRISGEVSISTVQNSTLENMGIPPFIVKILRRMSPQHFDEFKKEFSDLFTPLAKRGRGGFTQGDWEIEKIGQTLQEMGYIEGAKMLREFIANVLEVPISKLTMENSNRAMGDVGERDFQRDTILPKLTLIAEELTESLIPMFPSLEDTGAFYMFDNPVPEDTRLKIMKRRVNRTTGVTTPNEERQEDGMEPHESEAADELAPVRAPVEQSESMAAEAIDRAANGMINGMRNGVCQEDHE